MTGSPGRGAAKSAAGSAAKSAGFWPSPPVLFILSALAALVADFLTPLFAATAWVGAALLCLIVVLALAAFRSGAKGSEAKVAALALPLAFCGWAVVQLSQAPPGAPAAGVVARLLPQAETLQAALLPVSAGARSALRLEARLRSGPEADRNAAIADIARQPSAPLQKYLYQTAARFGGAGQSERVVIALLARQAGRRLPVNLRSDDNLTLQSQYLDGASLRVDPIDIASPSVRAALATNQETIRLAGTLAGPDLSLTGRASLADKGVPLTLTARLTPDLTLAGVFHFGEGKGDTPFTTPLWETGPAAPQSADTTPGDD